MSTSSMEGHYFEVEPGIELYYVDKGSGLPILFVPGWTFTSEVFHHQIEHFAQSFRVIAVDPRSHGRSTITLHGNDYATHASDLAKLVKALDLKDVVLVGWSFGCLTNWGYVKREGTHRLKAIVAVDLSPTPLSVDPQDWVEGSLEEIMAIYGTYLHSPKGQREFVERYAREVMIQRTLSDEEVGWIVEQSTKTPYYIASALFASGMLTNHMEEAKQVDASLPSLYIIAEHWADVAVPFVKKHCPRANVHVLGGHMMFWEHPDRFNKILEEFIRSL